jgi:hypothetical protein
VVWAIADREPTGASGVRLSGRVLWYARTRAREWSPVLKGVLVSVSFTSPGRLSSRADCCRVRGGTLGKVVSLVCKRRREEGGLIVVDGRREEEERINKTTKGGREGEASTVDQLPLSPTSAMTRSLTPPRLRGRNLTYTLLQRARDFRGTYHQTTTHHPAAAYLQRPLFCTTYRHCLPPMAMLESLLSRMYGGRTRTVLQ